MKNDISKIAIKNVKTKVSKFSLQIYAFVYTKVMNFPHSKCEFDLLTIFMFFSNIHKLQKVKIHLDHSQIVGRILGYVHDFLI